MTGPWIDRMDGAGKPHTSVHRDGHRIGLFHGEWWAYAADYSYRPPGRPPQGPAPVGPFLTLGEAKEFVQSQGFVSPIPFGENQ